MGGYCEGCGSTAECVCEEIAKQLDQEATLEAGLRKMVDAWRRLAREAEDTDARYAANLYECAAALENELNRK